MRKGSSLAPVVLLVGLAPAIAQAATSAKGLVGFNALNLTPALERNVYRSIGAVPKVAPPPNYLIHVGSKVPASMPIKPLPASVSRQAPHLKNDDYVKTDEGDVLLVKPQGRVIVDVITKAHGAAARAS
jgi:hypothetical protein